MTKAECRRAPVYCTRALVAQRRYYDRMFFRGGTWYTYQLI